QAPTTKRKKPSASPSPSFQSSPSPQAQQQPQQQQYIGVTSGAAAAAAAAQQERQSFALLSAETLRLWCDSAGAQLANRDALLCLAQEVTYQTRHLITKAAQRMRHSARRRLTVDDVDSACLASKSPRLIGHLAPPAELLTCPTPVRLPAEAVAGDPDLAGLRYLPETCLDPLLLLRRARVGSADPSVSAPLSILRVCNSSTNSLDSVNTGSLASSTATLTQAEAAYSAEIRRLLLLRRPLNRPIQSVSSSLKQPQQQRVKQQPGNSKQSPQQQPPFHHLLRHLASTDTPALGRILSRLLQFLGRLCRRFGHSPVLLSRCLRCLQACASNPHLTWPASEFAIAVHLLSCLLATTPPCSVWRPAEAVDLQEAAATLLARLSPSRGRQSNPLLRRLLLSSDGSAAASGLQSAAEMPPLLDRSWPAVRKSLPRLLAQLTPAIVGQTADVESVASAVRLRCRLLAYLRRLSMESVARRQADNESLSDEEEEELPVAADDVECDSESCRGAGEDCRDWRLAASVYSALASSDGFASMLDLPLYQFRRLCAASSVNFGLMSQQRQLQQGPDLLSSVAAADSIAENVDGLLMLLEQQQQQQQFLQEQHLSQALLPIDIGADVDVISPEAACSPNSRPPVLEPAMPQLGLMQDDPVPSQLPLLRDDDDVVESRGDLPVPDSDVSCMADLLNFGALSADQCSEASTLPAISDRPLTPPLASEEPPLRLAAEASPPQQQQQQKQKQTQQPPMFELISPPLPQPPAPHPQPQPPPPPLFSIDTDDLEVFDYPSRRPLQRQKRIVIRLLSNNSGAKMPTHTTHSGESSALPNCQQPAAGTESSEFYRLFQQLKWRFGWGIGRAAVASVSRGGIAGAFNSGIPGDSDLVAVLPDFAYPL
ncbi:hypothetical protein BOX15_Mlig018957g1, partial [Macrostomum lignano]